ncbi:Nif11-like leader peptide family natural product precursor [Scytonema sp. UIC 10036]|uniref:Nif11-like leader peptide family RiPP precursor n=1 Tax=Scytonema sp. UIC 10036 TaxID=2304196 RepID=UPI0012DA4D6F|nr:Nif11-like leader peptide family RiPP precursor [Scytonema sp. UIC 10036]MUG99604.1 Nif11-like leader peptide family natural product precursor [Scytonema sp. UIC 10036]
MSIEIFEKVKDFLIKLVKDEGFRTQLMSEKAEEVKKALESGGYNFSQQEFETAAITILELKELGEFHELSEEELVGAFGGISRIKDSVIQPMYGVIYWPPKGYPKPIPIDPQPMYGIVIDPVLQPMYGVVEPLELE